MAKDTPDVFELLNQIEQLKPKAIDELLAQRAAIDEKLALLGHFDTKTDTTPAKPKKTASKPSSETTDNPSANYNPKLECKVCKVLGHHTRAHNRHPESFTAQELADKGWKVPD